MHLSQTVLKPPAAKRLNRTTRGRVGIAVYLAQQLLILPAIAVCGYLHSPSWRWDLLAGVIYMGICTIVLRAIFRVADVAGAP